jgi:hypothetical protein
MHFSPKYDQGPENPKFCLYRVLAIGLPRMSANMNGFLKDKNLKWSPTVWVLLQNFIVGIIK